jgi:hypothetical protein
MTKLQIPCPLCDSRLTEPFAAEFIGHAIYACEACGHAWRQFERAGIRTPIDAERPTRPSERDDSASARHGWATRSAPSGATIIAAAILYALSIVNRLPQAVQRHSR